MELLEREALLDALDAHLRTAAGGRGALVTLAGEAGVGKSSLVDELCRRHATTATVVRGGCDAMSTRGRWSVMTSPVPHRRWRRPRRRGSAPPGLRAFLDC